MKVLLRTPAVAPVNTRGSSAGSGFFFIRPVAEEPDMSITARIVPWPLDRALVTRQAATAGLTGRANR